MVTLHSQPGELLELSCAVAQLLRRHAEEVEDRELQVRQRRVFWIYEMAAALESARASADEQRRERTVRMAIAVADGSAVKNHHVIEQGSVAVRRVSKLLQVVGEEFQVVLLNFDALRHFCRIVLVMCHRVMRLWNADLWVGPRTLLTPVHERADARDVRLISQKLQVVEQTRVVVEAPRNARGPRHVGYFFGALFLRLLDPPLDVAQRRQIVGHSPVVRRTEPPLQL